MFRSPAGFYDLRTCQTTKHVLLMQLIKRFRFASDLNYFFCWFTYRQFLFSSSKSTGQACVTSNEPPYWICQLFLISGGLRVGGPLMTSSHSVNRNKTFWSSLGKGYAGHPRIRRPTLNFGMADITENTKGISWCTTSKHWKLGR